MVSSLLVDSLHDPTRSLVELYDSVDNIDDFPATVSRHFSAIFKATDAFSEIPVLDVYNHPEEHIERSILRFRAMVQDTSPSPEMYLARRAGGRCGGWGLVDTTQGSDEGDVNYADLRECTVLWAVNIPGESSWCASEIDKACTSTPRHTHHPPPRPHKFPIPNAGHVGVQVKLYDTANAEYFKATDVVTFVGILTIECLHSEFESTIDVPTLHVLFSQPLLPTLIPRRYPSQSDIKQEREELLTWIADEALGGDRDAAEWVLLASISRVQSRTPPILPPSLTLSLFPSPTSLTTTPTLSYVLSSLLPLSLTLQLSLDLLNKQNFVPESRQEDLHSGYLQVPSGSNLLITESGVKEGKVCEKGIMNIRAIQEMMENQRLRYMFPFSSFEFTTDVTFVVLSEGRKSAFFQTSVVVPVHKNTDADLYKPMEEVRMPESEKMGRWRALVGGAMQGKVFVSDATSEFIQDDFVKQRQSDKLITSDDLIHQMTIARSMALSLHQTEVTTDIWNRMRALDARRS